MTALDFELLEGTPLKAMIGTRTVNGEVLEHERRVGFNNPPDQIRLDVWGGRTVTITSDQIISMTLQKPLIGDRFLEAC